MSELVAASDDPTYDSSLSTVRQCLQMASGSIDGLYFQER